MNEGAPMMYGNGGFGAPPPMYMVGAGGGVLERGRPYPLDVLQALGSAVPSPHVPHRSQHRRDHNHLAKRDSPAFGYDSDDSSLSSNASGSSKSVERGEGSSRGGHAGGWGGREWRGTGRPRREPRPPREPRRRVAPERYLASTYPFQVRFTPSDLFNGEGSSRRIAPERHLASTYPFQIRFTPDDLFNGSEWDKLSQEMWEKFITSQQTEETFRKKMNLWRYLYITIRSIFPRYGLYVVGSTMSGFGLDSSDMDLCLYVRAPDNHDPRAHALSHLNYILTYMKSLDPNAELIQAKVPILKFRDQRNGLQVDLNCNNVVGIRNTNLLYCFSTMDWRVRPLVALTKLWAQAHNINDARQRTLSSYSLTLMVIHFLQCGTTPAVLPRTWAGVLEGAGGGGGGGAGGAGWEGRRAHNTSTLAELFLHLLRYYAEFPYDKMAVSVRAGGRVPVAECRAVRAHKNDPHQWKLLCVEEPFDLTNTARSVYDPETFEKIVTTFRQSYARLAAGRSLRDAWPPAAPAGATQPR